MSFILRLHLRPSLCCKAAAGGGLLSMASSPENMEFVIDKKNIATAITLVDRECVKSNSILLEINADDFSHKWNSPLSIIDQICLWNYKVRQIANKQTNKPKTP